MGLEGACDHASAVALTVLCRDAACTARKLAYSNKNRPQVQYRYLVEHTGFDAGLDEHLPGVLTKKGVGLGFKAEASGRIVFFASDGWPAEKKVIVGFLRAPDCFRHAVADAQIYGLRPAACAGLKGHFHFDDAPTLRVKLPPRQKVSQFPEIGPHHFCKSGAVPNSVAAYRTMRNQAL
ncbi:hypothetical protein PH562_10280 [Rhizobium sp. CNPSo 4062]|nr:MULTISPECIES: hypothetical protein [unclassified Rhizobium]MDK4702628.1 hypothetical protein [Rhizobium sp. CNPSo 4062]MDK4711376.1 hypothetical protein [Rhizobium sp. CNPSo 4039]